MVILSCFLFCKLELVHDFILYAERYGLVYAFVVRISYKEPFLAAQFNNHFQYGGLQQRRNTQNEWSLNI